MTMVDRGPDYAVERRRLELQRGEHEDTIEKGRARMAEIERAKQRNLDRVDLANMELDAEASKIRENEQALTEKIEDIEQNLRAMVATTDRGA